LAEYGTDIKKISSKFFAQAVKEKNKHDHGESSRMPRNNLGIAIASAINLLDPEVSPHWRRFSGKTGDYLP
jgi:hypothetical protein